jgi:trigger factor
MGADQSTFREQLRPEAEKDVKTQLVLEKLCKVENITASEEELDEELKSMAENIKQDIDDFKKHLKDDDIEYIKTNVEIKKVIEFLVENAKIA